MSKGLFLLIWSHVLIMQGLFCSSSSKMPVPDCDEMKVATLKKDTQVCRAAVNRRDFLAPKESPE